MLIVPRAESELFVVQHRSIIMSRRPYDDEEYNFHDEPMPSPMPPSYFDQAQGKSRRGGAPSGRHRYRDPPASSSAAASTSRKSPSMASTAPVNSSSDEDDTYFPQQNNSDNDNNRVSFGYAHHHLDAYPRPDPIQSDARSTSDETGMTGFTGMTGDTKQKLFKVVKEQVKMVKSLTSANVANSAELERVRKENGRLQKQLAAKAHPSSSSRSRKSGAPVGSVASGSFAGGGQPLPPPPPMSAANAIDDDINTIATPYTVDTQLHDYGDNRAGAGSGGGLPKVTMYDKHGLGPKASFNRDRTNTDPSIDAFSTNVFPSARNVVESAPPILKKTSSWRKKSGGSSRRGGGHKDNNIQKKYAAPLPEPTGVDKGTSCASRCWASFAFACTFFVPDFLICKSGPAAKQAWREKIAICVVVFWVSAFFVGLFGFVPLFFCTETETYTFQDIYAKDREAWSIIHGTIYDMKPFMSIHIGGADGILDWLGKDSSKMFPRTPPADLPNKCLNVDKDLENFSQFQCVDMTDVDELLGLPCHKGVSKARLGVDKWLGDYRVGQLAFSGSTLQKDSNDWDWIVIRDRVYNVTNYVNGLRDENSGKIMKNPDESENAYLSPSLHSLVVNFLNNDATDIYSKLYETDDYIDCLNELFYVGVVDTRSNVACQALNTTMYVMLVFVAALLVLQCLCSLLYLARPHRSFTAKDGESAVMIMVPCYNEGDKELRKTINSVVETHYPSDNKVMVVVADGNITGKGESLSTPMVLSKILGFDIDEKEDAAYSYKSIGSLTKNRANVYSGTYEKGGKSLKYIVIVKCGIESESGSGRAGNRGKRDSQLIVTGLYNRVHHERQLCELDKAINCALNNLEVPAYDIEYLMTIDADTRVHEDSIHHMVYNMNKNEKILALCGETRVENKAQSLITMLQVFEYYTNHHMKKAFESVFGCVTCLPGCFTMYKIRAEDGRSLIAQDNVYSEYARNDIESLHEKNLYLLGEDRMLTTLLLKNFPDMRLSFVPEAACWTIVPHTYSILLSQRRRWINSTFHNMLELLKVKTMCGICCLSMKTIVILDLISTMILPASMLYAVYFIYLVFVTGEDISMLMLILYGVIIGVQVVIFLLRSRWDMLFFFIVFMVTGVPLFYFILPLYSFSKQDDFSWGATRQVSKTSEKEKASAPRGPSHPPRRVSSSPKGGEKIERTSASRKVGDTGKEGVRTANDGSRSRKPRPTRQLNEQDFGEC